MSTALLIVDVQNDFLPGGALAAEKGNEIIKPLVKLAAEVDGPVIASRDWHPKDHMSFSEEPLFEDGSWPVHCVQETHGAALHPQIEQVADIIVSKGTNPTTEAYSAFDVDDLPLSQWLEERDVDQIIIGGLVAEFCVKATALDAASDGFRTMVNINATAALSEQGEKEFVASMRKAGIHVSSRVPRGDREPTREESVQDAIDKIVMEAEEAERDGAMSLADWYTGVLMPWLRSYAEAQQEPFTLAIPTAFFNHVELIDIVEAQMSLQQ